MSVKRETVEQRKALPLASGVLDYFPDALLVVAEVSRVGNEQHHPGEPLHWDKSKSSDEADALLRHLLDRGTYDTDGLRHSGKVAWRALAMLQRELDREAELEANEPRVREKFLTAAEFEGALMLDRLQRDLDRLAPILPPQFTSEPWGEGDGIVYGMRDEAWHAYGLVENRGDWPPDTRVAGRLTCCGQTEHDLACPQYRW